MPRPATVAATARTAPSPIEHHAREKLRPAGPAIAAVVQDPASLDDAEQRRAAGPVAALALENERLKAELRAKVEELSASRARILESADAARRRLERDLHDGAQQRLVSLALGLRILRSRLEGDRDAVRAL